MITGNEVNRGLIHFCDEGKRLYDEYCAMLEDDEIESFGEEFIKIFDAYLEHKQNCSECRYV